MFDGLSLYFSADDIIETVNHFRAIDCCIDMAEESLTEDIIKELHRILKQCTKDSTLAWFERIYPFQDGNGRVGRLISFKECLRFGLIPFIIDDEKNCLTLEFAPYLF